MATRPTPADVSEHTRFGDVARERCGMHCQYAARYLAGEHDSPDLGSDLRWFGRTEDYHGLMVHKADADVFVRRLREFCIERGCGWSGEK